MSNGATDVTRNYLVGLTSRMTAGVRARESQREDRLFYDPWAEDLAGEIGMERCSQIEDDGASIATRIRFFDDFLQDVTFQHGVRQVVLPAAGLDTRAFRLNWPEGTRLFELDQASVLEYKEQVLRSAGARPRCERLTITVDLADASWKDALIRAGFAPDQPSLWLIEGLLFYLSNETILRLLEAVTALTAPGSWLGLDGFHSMAFTSPWTRARQERAASNGTPWIGSIDEPDVVLGSLGWQATVTWCSQKAVEFGRRCYPFIPADVNLPDPHKLNHWFVTARR